MTIGSANSLLPTLLLVLSLSALSFCLCVILVRWWKRDQLKKEERFQILFQTNSKSLGPQTQKSAGFSVAGGLFKKTRLFDIIRDELVLAGLIIRPDELLILWLFLVFVPSGMAALLGFGLLPSLALCLAGLAAPPMFIRMRKAKYLAKFDAQLSDALDIIGNCLKSGLTFLQALESISNEMEDPIAREFKRILREIKYGSTLETALTAMTQRMKSEDLLLMVSAVLIQRQVGGNLSQLLSNISVTIKERIKLKQEIRVITSTGRISGMVVGGLPVLLLLLLMLINPNYVSTFFTTKSGGIMLAVAGIMELIGFMFVQKIVSVKY